MIRRVFRVLLVILLIGVLCKACLVKDSDIITETRTPSGSSSAELTSYPAPENVTIDGIDYLESQAPVGNFGGELIASTIGEGPKTFNPFNSKDNTSSTMAGVMFDGLLTTNPVTGQPSPKLAKSYEISPDGKTYTIHLRRGIKWSDGKPITADDVVFTWRDIIFAGLGDTSTRDSLVIDDKLPTVRKIDDYTVEFTTPKPYAPFIRMLSASIAPKHYFLSAVKGGAETFDRFLGNNNTAKRYCSFRCF